MDLLVTNEEANIRIAAYHFKLYLALSKGNWERAVAAYNVGIGAVKRIGNPSNFGYVKAIKTKLAALKPFNKANGNVVDSESDNLYSSSS